MTEWSSFTRIPLKAQVYVRETYFREGLAAATEIFGDNAATALHQAALLLIKPDGLVAGKTPIIISFLRAHHFSIIAVELPSLSRFHWRELWRYQLNAATLDRLAVNDLVLRDQSLLLLLRNNGDPDLPATVRLSGIKGPSDVSLQPPECLRRLLGQPNRILSFIHVADEPADLLRELAIMLDEPALRRALAAFAHGELSPADESLLNEVVSSHEHTARTLDARPALQRVEDALRRGDSREQVAASAARRARSDLERMSRGERISWRPFAQALAATGIQLDKWDVATLGANFITYDEPGVSKLIKAVDAALWRHDPDGAG